MITQLMLLRVSLWCEFRFISPENDKISQKKKKTVLTCSLYNVCVCVCIRAVPVYVQKEKKSACVCVCERHREREIRERKRATEEVINYFSFY